MIAVLSRGYKEKPRGYALATEQSTALEIGDEPMQFYNKFPDVTVAVGEERVVAIPQLLHDKPDTRVIMLDDAFQHRSVKAGFNILLTDYNNLFTRDWFLPTGDLRDQQKSATESRYYRGYKMSAGSFTGGKKSAVSGKSNRQQTSIFFLPPFHMESRTR